MKFNPPTVTNGHVYVATGGGIMVYGVKSPAPCLNVTAQVKVRRGKLKRDKATGQMSQTVTLTNQSGSILPAPVTLALDNLSAGVRLALEAGSDNGTTSRALPSGVFYHNFPALAPRQSVSAVLRFLPSARSGAKANTAKYTPRVLVGGEAR